MLKKYFIVFMIIVSIVLGNYHIDIKANEPSIYQSSAMQDLVNTYLCIEDYLNTITVDSGIGYWQSVNELKKNGTASWLFDRGSAILDEKYSKEDYAELLTYLMSTNEVCLAEMIENTSSFDKNYNLTDFSKDMLSIAGDVLSSTNNLGLTSEGSAIDTMVGTVVDTIGDVPQLKDDIAEHKKYYYAIIQEYTSNIILLSAIYNNTDIEELKEASERMMEIEAKTLTGKLEYLGDNLESFVSFEAKIYAKDLAFPVLQTIAREEGDELSEIVAGAAGKVVKTIFGQGKLVYDTIMTFVGDLTFATTDTYRRQNELIALAEVARCVSSECANISIDNKLDRDTLNNIEKKLYYYSMLLRIHARGEYSVYKMITNQMNILVNFEETMSDIKNFIKSVFQGTPYVKERPNDEWIKSQLSTLSEMESVVNSLNDSAHFINSKSYVTGTVLCKDTGKGAFNAFIDLDSGDEGTCLVAKEGGNIKGYVTPGTYRMTIILDGYENYTEDIVITEEGTDIGNIVLRREGERENDDAENQMVKNTIEEYKRFIQSKNNSYRIYDIDKDGFPELFFSEMHYDEREAFTDIYTYVDGNFQLLDRTYDFIFWQAFPTYASYPNGNGIVQYGWGKGREIVTIETWDEGVNKSEDVYFTDFLTDETKDKQIYYKDTCDDAYDTEINHQFYQSDTSNPYFEGSCLLAYSAVDNFTAVYEAFDVSDDAQGNDSKETTVSTFPGVISLTAGEEKAIQSKTDNIDHIQYDNFGNNDESVIIQLHVNDNEESFHLDAVNLPYIENVYVTDINTTDSYSNIVVVISGEDNESSTYLFAYNNSDLYEIDNFRGRLVPESVTGDGSVLLVFWLGMSIQGYGSFTVHPEITVYDLNAQQETLHSGRTVYSDEGNHYEDGFNVVTMNDVEVYGDLTMSTVTGVVPSGSDVSCEYTGEHINEPYGTVFYITNGDVEGYVTGRFFKECCDGVRFAG